jgi:DNA replication and repair protein RecF
MVGNGKTYTPQCINRVIAEPEVKVADLMSFATHEDRANYQAMPAGSRLWLSRIALTNFRSYASAEVVADSGPVVLLGANGAGKTNLLEAISLLAPGNGLRRASYDDLARIGAGGDWAVAARINTRAGRLDIGTGQRPGNGEPSRAGRIVRIDGETVGPAALADHVDMVWLTPAMDGLFTGPGADRRAFLDRLVLCFDAGHATRSARFERAMRQRNRLLEEGGGRVQLDGLEMQMAEAGIAIAAARLEAVAALQAIGEMRRAREPNSPFPWFELQLEGTLETDLVAHAAIDAEDRYRARLGAARDRDRAATRTLEGPHRSDLAVAHGPKQMPARLCSTGEQKALLMGLVLAHAALIAARRDGAPPILLLDEVAAHFDAVRRAALFDEILSLGAQVWMTGTDPSAFSALAGKALFARVEQGGVRAETLTLW